MKKLSAAIFLAIMVFSFGCVSSTQNQNPMNDILMKTAIQYPVIKYMSKHPGQIEKAEELIEYLEVAVNMDEEITLLDIKNKAYEFIPWSDMDPADRLLLTALLDVVHDQLSIEIGSGLLGEDEKLFLETFFGWMEQAIAMSKM
jgi:hypothetical protein